jgi:succinoglycan biosynthesis protein ExoM
VDVSVCVATFRRPAGLARLLASLGRMKLPDGVLVEVVVVDNDPDTAEPARPLAAGALPVRRIHEPRQSIAHARNAAVGAARGRWLAFVDDDEEVCEGWLAAYLEQRERTPCDGLCGPVGARALRPEAGGLAWLAFFERESLESGARLPLSAARTGNAFLARRLFDAVAFDPDFGLSGGEDTRLFAELVARGAELRWCEPARVTEWVPPERLRAGWLLRRAFRAGSAHGRIARRSGGALRALPRALAACVAAALLAPLAALRGPLPRLRAAMRACGAAGRIFGLLGGRYEEYATARNEEYTTERNDEYPARGERG